MIQLISHTRYRTNVGMFERVASVVAGSLIAANGIKMRGAAGYLTAAAGAELVRRGATGHCYAYDLIGVSTAPVSANTSVPYPLGIRVDSSVTINRPAEEVYRFWRNFESLPRFMRHLESVVVLDETRSRWVAKGPGQRNVEWEAELISDVPNERVAWRSLPGSRVQNAGSVSFRPAPGDRGTEVRVELQYNPPAGLVGALVAWASGQEPSRQIREDLHHLKQALEAGEVPTTQGQSVGDRSPAYV